MEWVIAAAALVVVLILIVAAVRSLRQPRAQDPRSDLRRDGGTVAPTAMIVGGAAVAGASHDGSEPAPSPSPSDAGAVDSGGGWGGWGDGGAGGAGGGDGGGT